MAREPQAALDHFFDAKINVFRRHVRIIFFDARGALYAWFIVETDACGPQIRRMPERTWRPL